MMMYCNQKQHSLATIRHIVNGFMTSGYRSLIFSVMASEIRNVAVYGPTLYYNKINIGNSYCIKYLPTNVL